MIAVDGGLRMDYFFPGGIRIFEYFIGIFLQFMLIAVEKFVKWDFILKK